MTLALIMQVAQAVPNTPMELVRSSTLPTKIVLGILAVLSLVSWAIMIAKWWEFRAISSASRKFMNEFERLSRIDQVVQLAKRSKASPFTRVFSRGTQFLTDTRPMAAPAVPGHTAEYAVQSLAKLSGSQVEALRLVLDAETNAERDELGRFIPWLATIGSVSPLIGLLGTVLGVIDAFLGIATQGSGNIGAVAPGVAEALIATAAALSVAIPAVFGFNLFASRLNRLDSQLEGFGSELIALMVREGRV